jgi:hypothetical protein
MDLQVVDRADPESDMFGAVQKKFRFTDVLPVSVPEPRRGPWFFL